MKNILLLKNWPKSRGIFDFDLSIKTGSVCTFSRVFFFFYINSGKTGAYSEPLGLGPIFGQTNLLQFKYSKLRGNDILQHVFGRC